MVDSLLLDKADIKQPAMWSTYGKGETLFIKG
jgi:hypothetical protein